MNRILLPAVAFLVFLTGCTKEAYEGAVVGGAAGSAVGAILDEENPWRGAFIGGVIGAVVTGTVVEISNRAAEECSEYGRPVIYRCHKCREKVWIKATPVGWAGRCRVVKIQYFRGDKLIKVKRKKVCVRKRHHH
ncbi:MAG: YMGG-like glycine zipper-containing protein [Persephonella sp.]|nr:YMGG-like glycine zipper-containing protein [Persephonella sp.]